jgi:hypothetical protein
VTTSVLDVIVMVEFIDGLEFSTDIALLCFVMEVIDRRVAVIV